MKIEKLDNMTRGWFIGFFDPSVFKTSLFEVGILRHSKGETWPRHTHKIATEINCLISGKMTIQGVELNSGDIFTLLPGEIADPEFLEDCTVVVVKTPSIKEDKYEL